MSEGRSGLSPLRQALLTIERLEAEAFARRDQAGRAPIAIRSAALRLPGGVRDMDGLAELLWSGVDATSEVPAGRWDIDALHDARPEARGKIVTRRGGFLGDVAGFDAAFFGISPREAIHIDPQQRLLLELAWEAIERAGIAPDSLRGTRTGVFVGIGIGDWAVRLQRSGGLDDIDAYTGIGTGFAFAAGRVSFHLGLQGPAMAVDTACSSSLVAVHLAVQSLRAGECDLAIVGGVHLMLAAETMVVLSRTGALAPDGRCKTFDARADGYGRGEGAAMLVLSRLADQPAGTRALGVIRGSAVNHDGPSSAMTVPNGPAQQAVVRRALADAGVAGSDIGYVEAHGTGTALGDPMEVGALAAVLGGERPAPLRLGSIKTNIGHLEAAAGVAGLLKLCLVLDRGEVPPHLHLRRPNPHIPWSTLPVEVPTTVAPWPAGRPRLGGVSSFGLSGTNAHAVIEAVPPLAAGEAAPAALEICALSARTPSALRALALQAAEVVASSSAPLAELAWSMTAGRASLPYRLAVTGSTHAELASRLRERAARDAAELGAAPPVAFLFTGQGSPYPGMGRELYAAEPVFRAVIDDCDRIAAGALAVSPGAIVRGEIDAARLTDTALAQPALYALQCGLASLWASWGVAPDLVVGHSVGEIAAAWVAGAIALEDGMRFAIERGRAMGALPPGGAMVSARADASRVEPLLRGRVSLAAVNAPGQAVIAGDRAGVEAVVAALSAQGVAAVPLAVSHAFHSPLMDPALDAIGAAAPRAQRPAVPLISTLTGALLDEAPTADYWRRQARGAVRFLDAVRAAWSRGARFFVEIGPRPTLVALAAASLPEARHLLPSLKPGTPDRAVMRTALAALVDVGVAARPGEAFDARARRYAAVPTYPFEHERFWVDAVAPVAVGAVTAAAPSVPVESGHPLLGASTRLGSGDVVFRARVVADGVLADHRIGGLPIVPLSGYVDAALRALAIAVPGSPGAHRLDGLEVRQPLFVPVGEAQEVELTVSPRGAGAASVVVAARDAEAGGAFAELAVGSSSIRASALAPVRDVGALRARMAAPFPLAALFEGLAERGVEYGPAYRGMAEAWRGDSELLARVEGTAMPLDLAVQAVGMAATDGASTGLLFPTAVGVCTVDDLSAVAWVHARAAVGADGVTGEAEFLDADGRVVARLEGLRLARAEVRDVLRARDARLVGWAHETVWRPVEAGDLGAARAFAGQRWVVFSEGGAVATATRRALTGAGARVVQVFAGDAMREIEPDLLEVDPGEEASYAHALARAEAVLGGALDGAIHLWSQRGDGADAAQLATDSALRLARALGRASGAPRLVLVTRGAQPVESDDAALLAVFQAPVWGIGRAVAIEMPELRTGLVDLDPDGLADHGGDLLAALAVMDGEAGGGENQVAVRAGALRAARLVPVEAATRQSLTAASPLPIAAAATYVVTGGLGGLGLQVVEWLAARGARRIAILSRRPPASDVAARLASLRGEGVAVDAHACDLADAGAVSRTIAAIGGTIRGVVHLAAVIDDALIGEQTPARLAAALAPKVAGTWNLHRALGDLDFFVSFSSLVSIMGAGGQANYGAANAFVDAFAHLRRAQGLPATTVQWGPWAGAGTAQTLADQRRWGEMGLGKIPPSLGLRAIELAAGAGAATIAILPIAWDRFLARQPADAMPPIYAELRQAHARGDAPARDEVLLAALARASSPDERQAILLPYLQREAARILRLASPDAIAPTRPLTEIGFDSLLAVELRNTVQQGLGVTVKVSALFEHPTLLGLAGHLARDPRAAARPLQRIERVAPVRRAAPSTSGARARAVDLSLIYFASGTSGPDDDKYRHVLSSARFADEAGFRAIWIPERHFFEFGALYPDPSILAAALATVTRRIRLRAGSVVVPLHHPVHLAERWAMVDNLSGGRVDLSVATGWSPLDFVFAPGSYADRLKVMRDGVDTLTRLWRGDSVELTSGVGERVQVRAFPRPVQREVPIWYTCSGSVERFVEAGAAGAHVLTALLFQTYDQLGDKIAAYRRARAGAGHDPDTGVVTLMLHTFVHTDEDAVVPAIRAPFLAYLESTAKVWLEASSADTVRNVEKMSDEERADVLEMAFRRYVHTAGLFGTPEACREKIGELGELGVDEVACLVDFGVEPELVAESLRHVAALLPGQGDASDDDVEELVL